MDDNSKLCPWIKLWINKYYEQMEKMSNENLGILFRNIVFYSRREGAKMKPMDDFTDMFFSFIKADIDQRLKEYDEICERNRNNAPKSKSSYVEKSKAAEKKKPATSSHSKKSKSDSSQDNELYRILDELDE